jgi:hypothetical protein
MSVQAFQLDDEVEDEKEEHPNYNSGKIEEEVEIIEVAFQYSASGN